MAAVRGKDEWRFATMEYGGQCVTMAGMKWMPVEYNHQLQGMIDFYQSYTSVLISMIL